MRRSGEWRRRRTLAEGPSGRGRCLPGFLPGASRGFEGFSNLGTAKAEHLGAHDSPLGVFLEATVEDLTPAACRKGMADRANPCQRPIVAELTEALTSDDEAA